jgi:hypothetical protein
MDLVTAVDLVLMILEIVLGMMDFVSLLEAGLKILTALITIGCILLYYTLKIYFLVKKSKEQNKKPPF